MIFEKALNRILRRTEINVAVAGAVLGSVAAMSKLFPVIEHFNTLKVVFNNGAWLSWDCGSPEPIPHPWGDFQRWYHGRPQSPVYVMRHREGADMFKREDIRSYFIRRGERKQLPQGSESK